MAMALPPSVAAPVDVCQTVLPVGLATLAMPPSKAAYEASSHTETDSPLQQPQFTISLSATWAACTKNKSKTQTAPFLVAAPEA